jgi:hypothetical protein
MQETAQEIWHDSTYSLHYNLYNDFVLLFSSTSYILN